MANLVITKNELLPNVKITNIVLGQNRTGNTSFIDSLNDNKNLYLDVDVQLEDKDTELDKIITDSEYYKYITVTIFTQEGTSKFVSRSKQPLIINNQLLLNKKFKLNNINSDDFVIKVSATFDFESFSRDNKIDKDLLTFIINTYGGEESIVYPILENKKVVKSVNVQNKIQKSLIVDTRFIDGFDIQVKETITNNDKNFRLGFEYFQTHNNTNLTTFIVFDYKRFLRNTSFFASKSTDEFTYIIKIENNNKIIDQISVSKTLNSIIKFTSLNSISSVHQNDSVLIFSFTEDILNSAMSFKNEYKLTITNKDETFINYYNRLDNTGTFIEIKNSYDQFKNVLSLANTKKDNSKETFFLNPLTLKFQEDFINFYNQKVNYYNATFNNFKINIEINNLLTNIFEMYNKFSKEEEQLNKEQIDEIVELLSLNNTTYDLWLRFFNSIDKFFYSVENLLYKTVVTPTITKTKSFSTTVVRAPSYYSITADAAYTAYPQLSIEILRNTFNQNDALSVAKYFVTNNNSYSNDGDELKFDSISYNLINSYVNTKLKTNSKQLSKFNLIGFSNLEMFGASVNDTKTTTKQSKSLAVKDTNISSTNSKVPEVKNKFISATKLNNLQDNSKKSIANMNQILASIKNESNVTTMTTSFAYPKVILNRFDVSLNDWEIITDLKIIKNNDLIKLEIFEQPEIYSINNIGKEEIDLVNTYFIVNGVE